MSESVAHNPVARQRGTLSWPGFSGATLRVPDYIGVTPAGRPAGLFKSTTTTAIFLLDIMATVRDPLTPGTDIAVSAGLAKILVGQAKIFAETMAGFLPAPRTAKHHLTRGHLTSGMEPGNVLRHRIRRVVIRRAFFAGSIPHLRR